MKRFVLIAVLGIGFLIPLTTNSSTTHEGCAGNCSECHTLEKAEAEGIVKKVVPNGHILGIKISPIKSIWQIDITADGKLGALYLDFSKKYLIAGQIVPVDAIGRPPAAPQPAAKRKIDFSKLPLKDALVMGPKFAKKKIAVFTDPDCPYCRKLHGEIKQVLAKRRDVAFYIFLRPLPMHGKDAYDKAQAIICESSLALLDDALAGKPLPEPSCSTARRQIEKNGALADSFQLSGTPALIREDGMVNPGYLQADQLSSWIDGK